MNCLIFKDFLFFLGSSYWWPFFLLTVNKSYGFDSDKKNLLFGFLFHLFRIERHFQLLQNLSFLIYLVFTVTPSKLLIYAIIMHTRHKKQWIKSMNPQHSGRKLTKTPVMLRRDIPSQYMPLLCRAIVWSFFIR